MPFQKIVMPTMKELFGSHINPISSDAQQYKQQAGCRGSIPDKAGLSAGRCVKQICFCLFL